jgi:uncharacterized RDD family membrane protein YckC
MGSRFGAFLIDAIIVGAVASILAVIAGNSQGARLGFGVVIAFAYFGYFLGVRQQSVGMMALHIKVVDQATGGAIGLGRGLLRYLVQWASGFLCLVGYFSPFFDGTKRNQGWHDKVAGCFVVSAR